METFASWTEYTRFLIALVAVLDPLFAVPLFLSVAAGRPEIERRRLARDVSLVVLVVLVVAGFAGETILQVAGASFASFRIGGGLVLLLMALAMLNAQPGNVRQTAEEAQELENRDAGGAVPLAVPLLAGPGAISQVILAMQRPGWGHRMAVVGCIVLVCAGLWCVLRLSTRVARAMGTTGMRAVNRLLGLLLVSIAIEAMAAGLKQLFPLLAGA